MSTHPQEPTPPDERADDEPWPGEGDAPDIPAGEDVRIGPEQSDEPQAGAAEPTD